MNKTMIEARKIRGQVKFFPQYLYSTTAQGAFECWMPLQREEGGDGEESVAFDTFEAAYALCDRYDNGLADDDVGSARWDIYAGDWLDMDEPTITRYGREDFHETGSAF